MKTYLSYFSMGTNFRFKRFSVAHDMSSMKVGVDGVLIGCWGNIDGTRGLDLGCGCGLIAIMAAQRNPECRIDAIDIDRDSIREATMNFRNTDWARRLCAYEADVVSFSLCDDFMGKYDFIISNPPFFDAGLKNPETSREKARHQCSLTPENLLLSSSRLLTEGGSLSIIVPPDYARTLEDNGSKYGMAPYRKCCIADRPEKSCKRIMLSLRKVKTGLSEAGFSDETLFLRYVTGEYSSEYKSLTRDFYLNF